MRHCFCKKQKRCACIAKIQYIRKILTNLVRNLKTQVHNVCVVYTGSCMETESKVLVTIVLYCFSTPSDVDVRNRQHIIYSPGAVSFGVYLRKQRKPKVFQNSLHTVQQNLFNEQYLLENKRNKLRLIKQKFKTTFLCYLVHEVMDEICALSNKITVPFYFKTPVIHRPRSGLSNHLQFFFQAR